MSSFDEYRKKYGAKITICHIDKYDVSSTDIREAIKNNNKGFCNLILFDRLYSQYKRLGSVQKHQRCYNKSVPISFRRMT